MVYFKQYGAERTGTNYLKRLIELNFKDVEVFASILGWKHGMYQTRNNERCKCPSHEEWVNEKTKEGITYSVDNHKIKHSPSTLLEVCKQLNYLISIKSPYSFVLSFKKFRRPKKKWSDVNPKQWTVSYFNRYKMWLDLESTIVSYEDLIADYTSTLDHLCDKFNLTKKNEEYINEPKVVRASTDHGIMINRQVDFNTSYYLNEEYLQELPTDVIKIITDVISSDPKHCSIMERFNYSVV
jgi:hypothetical protein